MSLSFLNISSKSEEQFNNNVQKSPLSLSHNKEGIELN
jgi:hypothetical protein